jgi:hypothetical protein
LARRGESKPEEDDDRRLRRLDDLTASFKLSRGMASLDIHDPRRSSYGHDYWLHRCDGFRVESPDGRVGTVQGVRFQSSIEPELLEVRTGLFGRRLLLIPVEQVREILPTQRRISLNASPQRADTNIADRLAE